MGELVSFHKIVLFMLLFVLFFIVTIAYLLFLLMILSGKKPSSIVNVRACALPAT